MAIPFERSLLKLKRLLKIINLLKDYIIICRFPPFQMISLLIIYDFPF